MQGYVLTVKRVMAAPARDIFDVLADPARHPEFDGSGTVRGARTEGGTRLAFGDTFGMSMQMGVCYSTANTVVEFEENRRIAWQTGPKGRLEPYVAGRIWRYELEPADGGTLVRESWDIRPDHQRVLLKLGDIYSRKTRRDMERTLVRLDALVCGRPTTAEPD
ncbi:MAG: SRPBCC family protein [Acidimicrobiales bacterium]